MAISSDKHNMTIMPDISTWQLCLTDYIADIAEQTSGFHYFLFAELEFYFQGNIPLKRAKIELKK